MYFFLLLGLCLLIPFRFHMQVDDRRHTSPHHHQHDISVYACGVFMGAIYWFFGFCHSMAGRGDASLQPFLSLTTFLCWTYPMCFLCVWLLSVLVSSMAVPIHCQPLRSEASVDNSATAPRLGKNNPPRPHSVALALFSWIISSAIVNISWILSSLTSLSILTQHSPVLVRSSPLALTRSVMFCQSSSDVYL